MNKLVAAVPLVFVLTATGCSGPFTASTSNDRHSNSTTGVEPNSSASASASAIVQSASAGHTNIDDLTTVDAGQRVTVSAQDPWVLQSVTLDDGNGPMPQPAITATTWTSDPLKPSAAITITATFRSPVDGETQLLTRTVTTKPANGEFTVTAFPNAGSTSGVGVIPTLTFSREVPVSSRAQVVRNLVVTATPTPVSGSWRWLDSQTVAYRPASFWPGNSTVTVNAKLTNIQIPGKTTGWWGESDRTISFLTGRSLIVKIDSKHHRGVVKINGKQVRKFGVSTGKPGYVTRSGIKTITEKIEVTRMTNIGVTDDEVYDIQVPYAMRLTTSGEFLHGAPWNGNIGYANTSHGCTNLTLEDARYIFGKAMWGDPVVTTGTKRPMETTNGPGALWNIPYATWAN
ncbi:MAG: Ig-like domain-containing protein [Actinomycetes bacterium]